MKLKNVSKIYKIKDKTIYALNNITLDIDEKKGGFYVIKGHSGSGKTTLIQILGLLNEITNGSYEINGIDTNEYTENEKSYIRYTKFGFVFQSYCLIEHLNSYENVLSALLINKKIRKENRQSRVLQLLKLVNLDNRIEHYPKELSGGEQQRVAIARALANDPDVILADEPTGNLDENTERMIFELLKKISANKCVIVVSHSNYIDKYADKIYYMKDGKIL